MIKDQVVLILMGLSITFERKIHSLQLAESVAYSVRETLKVKQNYLCNRFQKTEVRSSRSQQNLANFTGKHLC